MNIPIKDKAFAKTIDESMNEKIEDYKNNGYDDTISLLRRTKLKQPLKDKLKDEMFKKSKAFETIKCNHKNNPTDADLILCPRCRNNKREIETEILLNSLNGNEKTVFRDLKLGDVDKNLTELRIKRDSLGAIMGYEWVWQ